MAGSRSKWKKHTVLMKSSGLRAHLPKTKSMSRKHFYSMLEKFEKIMVKPSYGWGGQGIMQVRRSSQGYEVRYDHRKKTGLSKKGAYSFVKRRLGKSSAIIQQYIRLARTSGRPFDLRVMVQRKSVKSSKWKVTGKLAKAAGKGYFITNVRRSRGRVLSVRTALQKSDIPKVSVEKILREVDRIALKSAKKFSKSYKIDTVGMDLGIDRNGKVWIIEGNFTPALSLFKKLDKKTYRYIVNFKKKKS